MSADDKLILIVGIMATAPMALFASVEPERFWLFCRVFGATCIGIARLVGIA